MESQKSLETLVEETLALTKENNRLLKAMRRDALIGGILKTVIWVALILTSLYFSAKFLEPYLGVLEGMSAEGGETDYGALFEQYKELLGQ